MEIVGLNADVNGHGLFSQVSEIEVVTAGGGIDEGVEPEVEAAGEGLADAGGGDGSEVYYVIERSDALGGEWETAFASTFDDALPVLSEAFVIGGHALSQDFANGA